MRALKKAIAGFLLVIGIPVVILSVSDLLSRDVSTEDKKNATAALVLVGLPPTLLGGLLVWGFYDDARRRERDRLRAAFFRLVKAGKGTISAFEFSMETGLAGDAARLYLDDRARTFNGTFYVDDEGGLFYRFHLGHANARLLLDESPAYDVVVRTVPEAQREAVRQVVATLMDCSPEEAEARLTEDLPVVAAGVSQAIADDYRRQLMAAGAIALVVWHGPTEPTSAS